MRPWRSFVILSDMRSGSNFLEHSLSQAKDVILHGEMFNPHHTSHDVADLDRLAQSGGAIAGFRLFPDHNDAVLAQVLSDPYCAKVILRRNSLDRYLSLALARHSDQWTWVAASEGQEGRVPFDPETYEQILRQEAAYWPPIWDTLRETGQVPFVLEYEDLTRVQIINGLLKFLGSATQVEQVSGHFKPQNPRAAQDKVTNPEDMAAALAGLASSDHGRIASASKFTWPDPKAQVRAWDDLTWCPVVGVSRPQIGAWLEAHLGPAVQEPQAMDPAMSIEIAPHPVQRAYDVFCDALLGWGPRDMPSIRARLDRNHGFALTACQAAPTPDALRTEFTKFLSFLRLNLRGQTAMAVRWPWMPMVRLMARALQEAAVSGAQVGAQACAPRIILCESDAHLRVPALLGHAAPWAPIQPEVRGPCALREIYTPEMDVLCAQAYRQDYDWLGCADFQAAD